MMIYIQGEIKRNLARKILSLVLLLTVGWLAWTRNPLPSDESMISTFHEHRSDLEEIVRRYREFELPANQSHTGWLQQGDTVELIARAKVYDVSYSAIGYPWYPNPYLMETGKRVEGDRGDLSRWDKYGSLLIKPEPSNHYYAFTLRHGLVWKDFEFFPEVPRIENGELLGPVDSGGKYTFRHPVRASLNRFSTRWREFQCIYRRIEPQWYLRMCNGH